MTIYSRGGDCGETDLFPWGRISKTDSRIEVLGNLDELNASLGVIRAHGLPAEWDAHVEGFQKALFRICAEISMPNAGSSETDAWLKRLTDEETAELESLIDALEAKLPPLDQMLCFHGPLPAAAAQLARTVCRRAERSAWRLNAEEAKKDEKEQSPISPVILRWLNRFSDYLFTLGRSLENLAK